MIDWGTGANQVSTADVPEQTNLYYTDARADARIVNAGSANWNTAFGWGDHSGAGYLTAITAQSLTSLSNVDAVVAGDDGKVLYYDHGTTSFKWKADDDVPAGYNNANWDTAYGLSLIHI